MSKYKVYTIDEYKEYLKGLSITRKISTVHVHHTWRPSYKDYKSGDDPLELQDAMADFHINERGFRDIAQHLTIFPDGKLVSGRDINVIPSSIGKGFNSGAFMFEMIGDFDTGKDSINEIQYRCAVEVTAFVLKDIVKLGSAVYASVSKGVVFHRDHVSYKTCPGTSIDKDKFINYVYDYIIKGKW